ncbi:nucleoside triphosphate pyrophosphohydrolase family protein [Shewanella sp. NIFS-20-20]|uniref:nucleoside triphosphate pyrophosphohydrolase family protein n=1 Tax=Shewanella sp. NIFS-20-20 TaxID=2853806 RepID=UPI001C46B204|nr:nucleoside triphosphate pyrophosphohydrolase family protein [Shewanella sp. NIFS-20-20]
MHLTELTPALYQHLYTDITEFRHAFELPVAATEAMETGSCQLHTSLIVEEMTELAQAANKIEQADALVDCVYVLMGRLVHLGAQAYDSRPDLAHMLDTLLQVARNLAIDFMPCWDEIHQSNMSKLCQSESELTATQAFYAAKGVRLNAFAKGGAWIVKCAADAMLDNKPIRAGKVLKSVGYRPADLSALV